MASERRIESARERLQQSRAEIFALAHAIKGGYPDDHEDGGFPRSRLLRAVLGSRGRMLLSGAALLATLLRPALLGGAGKVAGFLRPILLRYVLTRLLR